MLRWSSICCEDVLKRVVNQPHYPIEQKENDMNAINAQSSKSSARSSPSIVPSRTKHETPKADPVPKTKKMAIPTKKGTVNAYFKMQSKGQKVEVAMEAPVEVSDSESESESDSDAMESTPKKQIQKLSPTKPQSSKHRLQSKVVPTEDAELEELLEEDAKSHPKKRRMEEEEDKEAEETSEAPVKRRKESEQSNTLDSIVREAPAPSRTRMVKKTVTRSRVNNKGYTGRHRMGPH